MKTISKYSFIITALFLSFNLNAQCNSWVGSTVEEEASNAHTVYRQAMKTKEFDLAFENWQKAYQLAPTADGKRDYHFLDGAKLYLQKFSVSKDENLKNEYKTKALELFDKAVKCYEAGAIKTTRCGDNSDCYKQKIGFIYGRKAYDMFYIYNSKYSETLKALQLSIEKSGNNTEYIVFDPLANIVVFNFQKGLMKKEEARSIILKLNEIADYNIENNKKLSTYYQQAKDAMNSKFAAIESDIFDCAYFIEKLTPLYQENPEDIEVIKKVYGRFKKQNCDKSIPIVKELKGKWDKYVAVENAKIQAEFERKNPSVAAKRLYDEGKYTEAINKYKEALTNETDLDKKASYLFSLASIQFRKLKQYSTARKTALEAASLKKNWGRPYMLIGDMYASSARNCGDTWDQRLAILAAIDKYNYAKSIDSSVSDEAYSKIGKYNSSKPRKEDGFSRTISEGDKVKVGCWIGEMVKVRYAN